MGRGEEKEAEAKEKKHQSFLAFRHQKSLFNVCVIFHESQNSLSLFIVCPEQKRTL
jgi:hypothetical protein